ncbi:M14 family metallopeptidase [Prolixibacteraceae bacterium Z1-6]|uniref:M14 family metallopeptidase n=1 Tax=Draconibacterium aestuarii TaxID=2998507 RepID=A0A9X3FBK0_9BACT|nr:M14 family metallopeptidase [Prolixibacteraceae bacterium Z1-6]
MVRYIVLFIIITSISFAAKAADEAKIEVPLRFDRYYSYNDVIKALEALHKAFPELTTLEAIGKSEENRDIYALTINNTKTGDELNKPGVYVDGNIHGNEIQAGEVCLYYANMLLTKYGKNEKITNAVDRNTHYIIPVVNVDGRYHFFADGNTPSSNRSIRIPKDDDHDGLYDEDGPDDLDGDGNICQMRIKDPNGNYKVDSEDPRILVRVKPGEKGEYTLLGYEGIDNDNDGQFNEDAEGYLDPNRNWGYDWMPPYVQQGAGNFPLSGVGLKAINDFIASRPNIIVGYAFHNTGGMWLRAPAAKTIQLIKSDVTAFDVIGKEALKITPGYVYKPSFELYPTYGDFTSHLFFNHGAYGLVGELFMRSQETYKNDDKGVKEDDLESLRGNTQTARSREQLQFNDNVAQGELYKDWKPFNHPVYGPIEIGGWVKMSSRLPHPFMLQDLVHRNASVVLLSAENTPDIKMQVFNVKEIDKDLFRVRVRVENTNGLSSMTAQAVKDKLYVQDHLKVSGGKVVAGGKITNLRLNKVNYKQTKPEVQFFAMPGHSMVEYEFIIEGKGNVSFHYFSQKAKNAVASVKL